jgi:hypothetical protein
MFLYNYVQNPISRKGKILPKKIVERVPVHETMHISRSIAMATGSEALKCTGQSQSRQHRGSRQDRVGGTDPMPVAGAHGNTLSHAKR